MFCCPKQKKHSLHMELRLKQFHLAKSFSYNKLSWIRIQEDFRVDGRSNKDYRPMELETGIVSHASGSARLRLANTDILVGNTANGVLLSNEFAEVVISL